MDRESGKHSRRDFLAGGITALVGVSLPIQHIAGDSKREGHPSGMPQEGKSVRSRRTSLPLRGLMADAARLSEDVAYYDRLIEFCHEWNVNALLLSLTDDQGCAMRFKSHPELITHKNALTQEQARQLARHAQSQGVDLIPIIESFGHTHYITGVPKYAHLQDREPVPGSDFSAVNPISPETLSLMTDLYREAASIFPSRYLHGGCDEVNWGGSELSRKALQTKSRAQIWAEYLNSLDHAARGLGKEFIVWGDYVLHKEPDILPRLHKNIIVMDWQYDVTDPAPLEQAAQKALAAGLRVIGAPAVFSSRWGLRPGSAALRNIDAFADAYRGIDDPRALGVIVTNWMPSRYIQRSIWDTLAYAAIALVDGSEAARESAFRSFTENFYGAQWNENWNDLFRTYYAVTPSRWSPGPRVLPPLPVPWRNEKELQAAIKSGIRDVPPFTRLLSQLEFSEALVRSNVADFLAFRLSLEYLENLFWRNAALVEESSSQGRTAENSAALISTIAERDARLLAQLTAEWDRVRPADSAGKMGPLYNANDYDQLLYTFHQAADFSSKLAKDPERFSQLLQV